MKIMATVPSQDPTGGRREDSEVSTPNFLQGSPILEFINFEMESVSESDLRGSFIVSEKSALAFGVLHGGITAYIAETMASMGAAIVSEWSRVAGIGMNVVHLKEVPHGNKVMVKAVPLRIGKRIQVWDVTFSTEEKKITHSTEPGKIVTTPVAIGRITLMRSLQDPRKGKILDAPSTAVPTDGK
jgi:1,4-dihydroxy-2-naphthoyl-CoA hydrolase